MTYSIVARDARTGEFAVAVQSPYFQVGPSVPRGAGGSGRRGHPVSHRGRFRPPPRADVDGGRLLRVKRAHEAHNRAAQAHLQGDAEAAESAERDALELGPELIEIRFWTGIRMVERGRPDRARELLAPILDEQNWRALLPRLPASGRIGAETLAAIESLLR